MIKTPEIPKGNENFWEWNPDCIDLFDTFYKKDKSKNKVYSSKIMWAFDHKLNPDSIYYNLSDKEEMIKKKFLKDPKFDWSKYEEEEDLFKRSLLNQAEKSLYEWSEVMKKRDAYLKTINYYFDTYEVDDNGDNVLSKTGKPILLRGTAEQLDKAQERTIKYFKEYKEIEKDLKEEKLKRGRGNKPLSSSDANRI